MITGIEPTIIYFKLEIKYGIFLRKKKRTEKRVAKCKNTSKLKEGERPKKY